MMSLLELRLGFFGGGLVLFVLLGLLYPFIKNTHSLKDKIIRYGANLLTGASGALLTVVLFPGGLYLLAQRLEYSSWGFFNHIKLPYFFEILVTVIFLDLAIYAQHVLSHKIPYLWRFHKVHHGDPFFDTTTALRFHPGEIVISFLFKGSLILLFSLDKNAVLIFEIILNFSAMFNHSNFSLPKHIEKIVRKVIVTPDFHRIHHSPEKSFTNSNYGFFFSFWDRVFGTSNKSADNNNDFGLFNEPYSSSSNLLKIMAAPFKRH